MKVKVSLDVNDLIQESVGLADDDLRKHRILLRIDACPQKPRVMGDRIQLQQVLLNLVTNAIDSMVDESGPRILTVKSEVGREGGVEVSVGDTGIKIGPKDMDRIFNPLVTTKSGGMAMGLAICRSIVEAHDGRLWAIPNNPEGTIFRFVLRPDTGASVDSKEASASRYRVGDRQR